MELSLQSNVVKKAWQVAKWPDNIIFRSQLHLESQLTHLRIEELILFSYEIACTRQSRIVKFAIKGFVFELDMSADGSVILLGDKDHRSKEMDRSYKFDKGTKSEEETEKIDAEPEVDEGTEILNEVKKVLGNRIKLEA